MTFSIAGFCRETGQLGTAISSSSICVASRCPFIAPGRGVVLTQNVTNPALGQLGVQLLEEGLDAERVLERLREHEAYPEWRQLQVLDAEGASAVHSGEEALGLHATRQGRDCVAGGNMLADEAVIEAMVAAFEAQEGELAERLLAAMDAGLAAGGEMGPVYSAGLKVADRASWPVVDLRVDWHIAPLAELRMIWEHYRPQRDAYVLRAVRPDASPSYGVPGDER
ncbi:DUF1028 domain-containing protein [Halomonas stenophila]|uniref:Putative Ntn-hydrolase superfamily protein n=1 Tax=Halomonas stenophila TaxID=795312 RepID=A0A7W5ET46_9GAMM|nr:DUF1028 domain-containing protein [Halomonas stenophila]MBB3231003.1 putative Ntn-hydrolase superfamily protein [Halomonas stenophila]